ncbi:hypothetical protein NHJ13734_009836 [Beauveria thailandica]
MADTMPPGTIKLIAESSEHGNILLHPKPTDDHDDPLNWPAWRKALNYGIVLFYVAVTFSLLDIPIIGQALVQRELDMTDSDIAMATAFNFVGLALAGILFMPLTYRYGRRPIYLLSIMIQFAGSMWVASVQTKPEYVICSIVLGIGGSIAQIIVPMTIADLFFVHQFATMNGWFLFAQGTGAFLGPVAAGFILASQGQSWMWWWNAIFLTALFVLVFFGMEESTFVPDIQSPAGGMSKESDSHNDCLFGFDTEDLDLVDIHRKMSVAPTAKALRTRLSLITHTKRPIKKRFLTPFAMLVKLPAVSYTAITYGFIMACLAMIMAVLATRMASSPYNFDSRTLVGAAMVADAAEMRRYPVRAALERRQNRNRGQREGGQSNNNGNQNGNGGNGGGNLQLDPNVL